MPEFSNYVEALDPVVGALDGTEMLAASKDGDPKSLTSQQIADLGGGSVPDASPTTKGIVEVAIMSEVVAGTDVGGTGAALSVLPSQLGITRTVTGADADVQTDHNGLIILNSATPFNFTLDQFLAKTKITFINYGAGVVTFVNGAGVTAAGNLTLAGATGTSYPSALVIYDTLTTPRVISGGSLLTNTLPSTQILVGNGSGVATAVAMSGQATISNTGAVTLDNAAVIAKVLTGFTAGAGTITAADSILSALQKIVGNVAATFTRGANAFGGASDLGLTDNFNLTLQTGVASLLFETNAVTRLTITSTGAAAWASTATTSAFVVDSTLGAASAEQIALRIGGITKFAVRDNGQITMNPTSGMINTGAALIFSTSASQNTLYDFATVVNTTNSVTGMRSTFGTYVWSATNGQSVVGINSTGSFAAAGGTTSCVSFYANPTFNTTSSYVGGGCRIPLLGYSNKRNRTYNLRNKNRYRLGIKWIWDSYTDGNY